MNIKFGRASSKDKYKVTLRISPLLSGEDNILATLYSKNDFRQGQEFILVVEGVATVFYVNRDRETLSTNAFPRKLRMPTVGSPRFYNVTDIRKISK